MNLKKNAVSYVTWMIVLLFTGAAFAFLGMVAAQLSNINILLAAAGCIVVFFGVLYLVYSMTGYVVSMRITNISIPFLEKYASVAEKVLLLLSLAGAIAIRVYFLPMAGEDAAYFEVSKVTNQNGILVQSVQGSVYLYCILLHTVFLFVGNHWMAGIWVQIILQLVGALVLYFALKKLVNLWSAIFVYAYLVFTPASIEAGLTYSPQIMYFCIFSLVLWAFADFFKRTMKEEEYPAYKWVYTGVLGVLTGICIYIDITGILFLGMLFYFLMLNRENADRKLWLLRAGLLVLTAIVSFCLVLLVDGIVSDTPFIRVLNAWFVTYSSPELSFHRITEEASIELFVAMMLVSLGALSFWRRKKEERFTPFVFMCIGIAMLHFCGITTENMSGSYLLYVLFTILASVSITELFYGETQESKVENEEEQFEVIDLEEPVKKEEKEVVKPRLIESPLPMPKKHVKKNLDYAFSPKERDMKYDVLVSDSDDYDI